MKQHNEEPVKGSVEFYLEERKRRTIEHRKALLESMVLRSLFLEISIFVEGLTSQLLSVLLGVQDKEKSKIFGHGGKSFSYDTKMELLIEIGALSKEDRKLFELFGAIRNQFAHNWRANTAVETMVFLQSIQPSLWKERCPNWEERKESDYVKAIEGICKDVERKAIEIITIAEAKQKAEIEYEVNKFTHAKMVGLIPTVGLMVRKRIEDKIASKHQWTGKDLSDIVDDFQSMMLDELSREFDAWSLANRLKEDLDTDARA